MSKLKVQNYAYQLSLSKAYSLFPIMGIAITVFLVSFCVLPVQSQGCWTRIADMPQARYNAVSFAIDDIGYVLTGQSTGGTWRDEFFKYDPITNLWTQLPDFPGTPRTGAVGFSVNGKGYIGTGRDDSGNRNDFWEYDPMTSIWTQKANYPDGNYESALGFSIGNKGYVATGLTWSTAQKTFFEYDPPTDTWTRKADFPVATGRHNMVGFSIGNKGYVGTGYHSGFTRNNDFWSYDPVSNGWQRLADVPGSARAGAVGFSVAGVGYMGIGNQNMDFYSYDVVSNTWSQITSYGPGKRDDAASFVLNGIAYVGSGFYLGTKADWWQLDLPSYQYETPITGCDSVLFNAVHYTASDTVVTVVPGVALNGCDSIYVQPIVIHTAISVDLPDLIACDSALINGIYFTQDTIVRQHLSSLITGCDSTVSLRLTILPTALSTDTQTACQSYTWIDGNTYTVSNTTATFNLQGAAANGCDSLVALQLTILPQASSEDVQTACQPYTWIDGNTYTASNTTAIFNLQGAAANGCDSLVTLNLTIQTVADVSTSVNAQQITANNLNASNYQWLDCDAGMSLLLGETAVIFLPSTNGNYAVQITENGCIDTSACVPFILSGLIENVFQRHISVYPNPTAGNLTIQFEQFQKELITRLFTSSGQILETHTYHHIDYVDMHIKYPAGVYLMEIQNGEGDKAVIRVVKLW